MDRSAMIKCKNKILSWFKNYSLLKSYLLAMGLGFLIAIAEIVRYSGNDYEGILGVLLWIILLPLGILEEFKEVLILGFLMGLFLMHPIILTVSNIIFTVIPVKKVLEFLNRKLAKAACWPMLALVCMIPLLHSRACSFLGL